MRVTNVEMSNSLLRWSLLLHSPTPASNHGLRLLDRDLDRDLERDLDRDLDGDFDRDFDRGDCLRRGGGDRERDRERERDRPRPPPLPPPPRLLAPSSTSLMRRPWSSSPSSLSNARRMSDFDEKQTTPSLRLRLVSA